MSTAFIADEFPAGFTGVETAIVHRETEAPYFETLLGTGEK